MDNQRLLLVLALGLILFMIYQAWQDEQRRAAAPAPAAVTAPAPGGASKSAQPAPPPQAVQPGEVPAVPAQERPAPAATTTPREARTNLPAGTRVTVSTDVFEATIDTAGGDLRDLKLRKYPISVEQPNTPFVLLTDEPGKDVYVAQSGLIGSGAHFPTHRTTYSAAAQHYALADGQTEVKVPLQWQAPDGVRYTKLYTFYRDRYVIDIDFIVDNTASTPWQGYLYRQFRRHYIQHKRGWFSLPIFTGGAIYTPEEKYEKISFSKMSEKPLERDVTGGWVAMLQHYFVGAWMPAKEERDRFYSHALSDNIYTLGIKDLTPTKIAPGKSAQLRATLYAGPKEHTRLKKLPAEGMDLTVDYGWLTVISGPLFLLLKFIHRWIGNWGWSIVALTVLIKLVFYPLSAASYKSMAHMKRMQPKMQSLRERFGHDRQRMNQAMMEMYKKEKINPLGGCLPIAIQIPVFIALYWVLLESVELRQAPFIFWIKDLSVKDPYYVLPILMGVSMFVQQQLAPTQLDPMQRKLMLALPVVFTVFFLTFPAGLVLYWLVNNCLSIAQQWHITRTIAAREK
jgi:YidC/Oxa1 family membrane protein insertase